MVWVYGGCIEPGGMELDNERYDAPCPDCGATAHHHYFQRADGGCINPYHTVYCEQCGHSSGFDDLTP